MWYIIVGILQTIIVRTLGLHGSLEHMQSNGSWWFYIPEVLLYAFFWWAVVNWMIKKGKESDMQRSMDRVEDALIGELDAMPIFSEAVGKFNTPVEKAQAILDARKRLQVCRSAGICPECGDKLKCHWWGDNNENLPEDYNIYYCDSCKKRFDVEVDTY